MWYYCSLTDLFTDGGEQEVIVYVSTLWIQDSFPLGTVMRISFIHLKSISLLIWLLFLFKETLFDLML